MFFCFYMNKINIEQPKIQLNQTFFDTILKRLKNEAPQIKQGINELGGITEQNYKKIGKSLLDTLIYETILELKMMPDTKIEDLVKTIRKDIINRAVMVVENNFETNLNIEDEQTNALCKEVQEKINDFMSDVLAQQNQYTHKNANNKAGNKNIKNGKDSAPDFK